MSYDIMNKRVRVCENGYLAFFDTDSKFNIMTNKVYESLNDCKLENSDIYLIGFGKKNRANKITPYGKILKSMMRIII